MQEKDRQEDVDDAASRRQFLRRLGTAFFTLLVVDVNPVITGVAHAQVPPACGNGVPDSNCSSTTNDANCGISQVPNPSHDTDQNCSSTSADPDQGCGDCDDNHNSDEHCGVGTDTDELCGHQHFISNTEDQACSASQPDEGCGEHVTTYGGGDTDTDQHCVSPNPDLDCSGQAADQFCNAPTNPSTTSPDESCTATSTDAACGYYDKDEACGNGGGTNKDESCGPKFMDLNDQDNNCAISDPDENCAESLGSLSNDKDENCGSGQTDESCSMVNFQTDENCGLGCPTDPDDGW